MSLLEKMRGDRQGWYKVSALAVGAEIAVPSEGGGIFWDEIVSITPVGRERVWDVEVEGTHNFVGNDIFAHNTAFVVDSTTHNVGIGTASPYARLSVVDTTAGLHDIFAIASSTTLGNIFAVDSYGAVHGDGAYSSPAADYAEYFYTNSINLQSGEVVCVDVIENNAVKRCERGADNNVMGIVSTKPSVIGNSSKAAAADPAHYAIIGMMGQVNAFASAENGPINVGDSLTSASSTPGYAMRADGGDSTVGIALEPLKGGTGIIKVLISRRNKSLAVEEIEALVVERVANMKIEDRVQQLVTDATNNIVLEKLAISGNVFAGAYETANMPGTAFTIGSTTLTAEIPSTVLTADGKGVDLYKLATYNLSGIQALATRIDAHEMRLTSLETRVTALESGAISASSGAPTLSTSTSALASAFNAFGVFIQKGIAQFGTLVADQFVAATNSAGSSSAGTVTIPFGNTVALVNNAYVTPTSKIFVTLTASTTGSWYISDKQVGSFKVVLSETQHADVSFDYFLVQTEGQIATSTPDLLRGETPQSDRTPPVITLLGDNPVHISVGGTFVEPGVSVTDNVDPSTAFGAGGTLPIVTYINGMQADTSTIDTSKQTTYVITYSATDAAGNNATTVTRSVIVGAASSEQQAGAGDNSPANTIAPVVTLVGDAAIEMATTSTPFIDPGATALDDTDGDLTAEIVESGTVDAATLGVYTLTYTAADNAGNVGSASRVVTVIAPAMP